MSIAVKLLVLISTVFANTDGVIAKAEKPIVIVERIFTEYIRHQESTESSYKKEAMQDALATLQSSATSKDLPLLINVWMYYDPTDFPTRRLIEQVFTRLGKAAQKAVEYRLKHRKKWESKESAPYLDLLALQKRLAEPQNKN